MRRALILLALLLALLPPPLPLGAQAGIGLSGVKVLAPGVSARAWTVEQGLPQSTVTELVTDPDGYLWGATFGGLFRFDGRTVQSYSAAEVPLLVSNSVSALASHAQELWVGTPAGTVARLHQGRVVDSTPQMPRDQGTRTIDAVHVDRRGRLWVREGPDVHYLSRGRWSARLPYRATSNVVHDSTGAVYFLGEQGLVRVGADDVARLVATPRVSPSSGADALHVDATGRIWMATSSGLWSFANGRLHRESEVGEAVRTVTTDSIGDLWFSAGARLYHRTFRKSFGGKDTTRAVLDAGTTILSLAMLHDGLLALGTFEGLLVVRQYPIRLVRGGIDGAAGEAASLAVTLDGTLYAADRCGLRRRPRGTTVMQAPGVTLRGCARSLLVDRDGALWISSDGLLQRTTPTPALPGSANGGRRARRDTTFTIRGYLNNTLPEVQPLLAVGDTVLFGLSDGRIGRVLPNDVVEFLPGWTVPTDVAVHSLARARDGSLWVGQMGMISRQQGDAITHLHALHGVPAAAPRALLPDEHGGVWIGTYGSGLWYLRDGARARAVPLLDRTVSALILDDDARLWMPGNRGLTVVAMADLERFIADSSAAPGARLLSFAEGVPEGNYGRPAAARVAPGVLAFATVSGVVEVRTGEVVTAGVTPPVRIDSVRSGAGTRFDMYGFARLVPRDRTVQMGFSIPTFRYPDVVRSRYRLVGRDSTWLSLGANRELRLVGLAPGSYTLLLEARVPGGLWRAATPWRFEVIPTFSERLWPRVVALAVVLALVLLLVGLRERATRATARAREVELHARRAAAELAEQHQRELAQVSRVAVAGELTASLSHELGQPLAAIVNNAEVARRILTRSYAAVGSMPAGVEQALLDVVAQGRRASEVVREFRRFLRREQGVREAMPVAELIDSCTVLLRQEYRASRVRLEVQVAEGTPSVYGERVLVQQVLVNLLQNACEAARSQAAGRVLVRARPVADGVRITVADNGNGFAADVRRSAFEPFVTTRANGMGMGLAIARRVVEAHGGRIGLGQLPSGGGVVSLWLPSHPAAVGHADHTLTSQMSHG